MKRKLTIMAIAILFALLVCLTALPTTANATTDKAMSISGFGAVGNPDPWYPLRNIWAAQFTSWGYDTWNAFAPSKAQFGAYLSDNDCTFVWIKAHGTPTMFTLQDGVPVRASDVEAWLLNKNKKTFVYLHHCDGMCSMGPGTFSHAYRKGSFSNTVTIGSCGLGGKGTGAWYQTFFDELDGGATFKDAYNSANEDFPSLAGLMRFAGDEAMTLANCCEVLPDLRVEDFWADGSLIRYTIKNYGNGNAGYSFTGLKVDGKYTDFWKTPPVSNGGTTGGAFGFYEWTCTGESDTIEVIADYPPGHVEESDESNNGMTKIFTCGGDAGKNCIGADLTPIKIFSQYDKITFEVKNLGTLPSVTCYHAIYFYQNGHWTYQGRKKASAQEPGVIKTLRSYIYRPPQGTRIRVVVNADQAFSDCNPENDKMEVRV